MPSSKPSEPLVGSMLLKSLSPKMRDYLRRIEEAGPSGYRVGITNATMRALEERLLVTCDLDPKSTFMGFWKLTELGRAVRAL